AVPGVVGDVQRLQVVRGDDVLWQATDGEVLDDLEAPLVDDIDRVALRVRDVDERAGEAGGAADATRRVGRVDVLLPEAGASGTELGQARNRPLVRAAAGEQDSATD